ncbi:RagB/SusD family nutrient uptake outer membrane protein [Parabacteroides timonensis]|uniref:RagB/SusD family nutrient uptake outer membrane protein n=1 Tax=Parabacteroides timonensis TaxID=1871013 RepID=UPI00094EB5E3|nr:MULTISPECIES: RagB/SusD family nutrient uptake outer membrane protein [Parabacteroides]
MKTYINKIVATGLCSLLLFTSSCSSFLSEEPKDFLSPENLPNTESECNMLLMGAMSYWRSNNFERHINFIAEATTDAVVSATKNNIPRDEMNSLIWQDDNESLYKPWQQFYACINASNIMIQKVPDASKVSEDVKNQYVAAARYMRALSYFYLVRIFNDVIYLDTPVEDFTSATDLSKTPAIDIYRSIIEDLEYAETNLPVKWSEGTERPTVAAAKSLLAWVYITMAGEQVKDNTMWAKAAAKAKEVIDNKGSYGIELLSNYEDLWKVNNRYNKESIFAFNFADGLGDNQCGAEWRPTSVGTESGWGFFYTQQSYLDKFEDKDLRKAATFLTEIVSTVDKKTYTTADFGSPYPHGKKWCDGGREDFSQRSKRTDMYIPIIRYADVLLIFAEAENEVNGPTAAAYEAVNQLRLRAGLDNLSGLGKDTFREAIRKEWTLETTHERIYRFNLVRWGTYLSTMKEYFQQYYPEKVKNVTEEKLYFPCPNHDAIINPNL